MNAIRKVRLALILFAIVISVGTVGYMLIERVGPIDALYMTIITVAAVGYAEVIPLSTTGRVFTILLIVSGLATWTFVVVTLVAFVVEGEFREVLRQARIRKRIARMKNHIIVCGVGQAGRSALKEILSRKLPCVVVDSSADKVASLRDRYPSLCAILGDATSDEILEIAGVHSAGGLIAATESDASNLFIVLTARTRNPELVITARAARPESRAKLKRAGADFVVMPNITGGLRMASTLLRPHVVGFLDVAMHGEEETLRLEQAAVPNDSPLVGRSLEEAAISSQTGTLLLAISHASGDHTFNPNPGETIQPGDTLIVVGRAEQLNVLSALITGERASLPV